MINIVAVLVVVAVVVVVCGKAVYQHFFKREKFSIHSQQFPIFIAPLFCLLPPLECYCIPNSQKFIGDDSGRVMLEAAAAAAEHNEN